MPRKRSCADTTRAYRTGGLKAAREARGWRWDIETTAAKADLDPSSLGRIERGESQLSLRSLVRLADVLHIHGLAEMLSPLGVDGKYQRRVFTEEIHIALWLPEAALK